MSRPSGKIHMLQRHHHLLFNTDCISKPDEQWFEPQHWLSAGKAHSAQGGRGNVLFINDADQHWVLRHYRRGGLIGKLIADRYLWTGAEHTRAFRELNLLMHLRQQGLPVPVPVAARYQRQGLLYRADLITAVVPHSRTLAACLIDGTLPLTLWQEVGVTIARFHAAGVQHADLNANNILIDAQQKVWLLDFDRGRLRAAQRDWTNAVLARLLRSLNKLRERKGLQFTDAGWQALCAAHDAALKT